MTDKEFDKLLSDSLTSDEVPPALNSALLEKAARRKKAKILTFTKSASAAAAIFICAIAVLTYYNTDRMTPADEAAPAAEIWQDKAETEQSVPAETDSAAASKQSNEVPTQTKQPSAPQTQSHKPYTKNTESGVTEDYSCKEAVPAAFSLRASESAESGETEQPAFDESFDSASSADEEMLKTADSRIESSEEAVERAREACTVVYDKADATYDSGTDVWRVIFYTEESPAGNQCVYIDGNGIIQKIVYGE